MQFVALATIEISFSIVDSGSDLIVHKGIIWGTTVNINEINNLGIFNSNKMGNQLVDTIGGLTPNQKIYFKAFAKNSSFTGISEVDSLNLPIYIPPNLAIGDNFAPISQLEANKGVRLVGSFKVYGCSCDHI